MLPSAQKRTRLHRTLRGITLFEVLIVTGILAVLAAILFGPVQNARRSGQRTVAISNLRQCYVALQLYAEDYGGLPVLPSLEVARQIIPNEVTKDPADTWPSRTGQVIDPLVGSFGYIRGAPPFDRDDGYDMIEYIVREGYDYRLMVSPFYGKESVPYNPWGFLPFQAPDRLLCLYFDGRLKHEKTKHTLKNRGFSWASAFNPPYPPIY